MWLFVLFDLPTFTKKEKRIAAGFRKNLIKDGYTMMQYSVYVRHCASWQSAQVHIKRVKMMLPESGHINILQITDKQYGDIVNFWGRKTEPLAEQPKQLEMF